MARELLSTLLVAKKITFLAPLALALSLFAMASPSKAEAQAPGFRFGFHLGGGGFLGDAEGGLGGAVLQLGLKLSDSVSLYYQAHGLLAGFSTPTTDSVGFFNWNTLALELGSEPFRIAAGPSLDFVAGCSVQEGADSAVCGDGGPFLGINARAAIWLRGLTIWLDGHPTFYGDGTSVAVLAGLGFQN